MAVTPDKGKVEKITIDKVRENHANSKRYEYEDKGSRVYVIGQRPLDSWVGRWLYDLLEDKDNYSETVFNLGLIHEGFISPDTGKTLGFSDDPGGYYIGQDKERLLSSYKFGATGYNADIIDKAEKIVEAEYLKRHQTTLKCFTKRTGMVLVEKFTISSQKTVRTLLMLFSRREKNWHKKKMLHSFSTKNKWLEFKAAHQLPAVCSSCIVKVVMNV